MEVDVSPVNGNLPRQRPRSLGLFSRRLLYLHENFAGQSNFPRVHLRPDELLSLNCSKR